MKAPLFLSLLAGIYLSGMTGIIHSMDLTRSGAKSIHYTDVKERTADHSVSHQETRDSRGSEAAAASEEPGQVALLEHLSSPDPETILIQDLFKPAGSSFTTLQLHGVEGEKVVIEVFDISGKLVLTRNEVMDSADSGFLLNFSHAMDGVYFVRATAGEKHTSIKYVKQSVG